MRRSIRLVALLGLFVTVISLPDAANAVEESVFFFRSVEVGNVVRKEVCDRGAAFLDIEDRGLPKDTDLVMLDAELWSNRIQAKNEEVVKPEGRRVGAGEACVWMSADKLFGTSPIHPHQPLPSVPFYAEFAIGDWILPGGGECLMTSNTIPVSSLGLVGCSLVISPDEKQGLLGGNAVSNSVFNPLGLTGFRTGSYWLLHIYTK